MPEVPAILRELEAESRAAVESQGIAPSEVIVRRRTAHLRLRGQDTSIPIEIGSTPALSTLEETFAREYQSLYGYPPSARAIEVETVRVIASSRPAGPAAPNDRPRHRLDPEPLRESKAWFNACHARTTLFERSGLPPGSQVRGPALILESHGTTVVPPDWQAQVDHAGALLLSRANTGSLPRSSAVHHELLISRLTSIATDMGETLRATALSTNVKERLDFSCAILDPDANLVVNAPHIPVHLGALGLCVRMIREAIAMEAGDVVVTNHPAFGGSHLPDITVVTPVFAGDQLIAYVASRAHHAEIGGTRPGSMPPGARTLAEEGVVIPPTYLVKSGQSKLDEFRRLLTSAPHPTRQPDDNLADIQAQIAANNRGVQAIMALVRESNAEDLARTMSALTDRAHQRTLAALKRFAGQTLEANEQLDDGSPIRVRIDVNKDGRARVDFSGSSPTHPGNFNTPLGVARSALMYVLRLLMNEPLPLNDGILRAIDLHIPEGMLNPRFDSDPTSCPAVAAGNCETSQRIVDTLLKAFGLAACSQGTMNNLIFGNESFGYYETICGGSGGTAAAPGADAVHTHMTNTRITDPEILEHRYPVRLERFEVRQSSGGRGHHRGGHGAIRDYTFLAPVSVSLLTQHRTIAPYGTADGGPGQRGRQTLTLPTGETHELGPVESLDLPANSRLTIQTPGGGGFGAT
jgi:5-oxoprolinase (ATP-hydrolysing)